MMDNYKIALVKVIDKPANVSYENEINTSRICILLLLIYDLYFYP